MHILVTAGNTQAPIDRVRCITNIFSGRTGTRLALMARERGHDVTLLTSHPEVVGDLAPPPLLLAEHWRVARFRTFDDLQSLLAELLAGGRNDAVLHSAAVSDYLTGGVYASVIGTYFAPNTGQWSGTPAPMLEDRAAGKVKSDEQELWIRLVRAPKLIDRMRRDWGFRGVLVKFKLEVGVSENELQAIAERSRQQSAANLMVANTLEGAPHWALLGPLAGRYVKVSRRELATSLLAEVEQMHAEKQAHKLATDEHG